MVVGLVLVIYYIFQINNIPFHSLAIQNLKNTRLGTSIYASVYAIRKEFSDDATRIAIIYPFNWILLNYKYRIYIYVPDANVVGCAGTDTTKFALLKSQLNANMFSNMKIICLPISVENLLNNFSTKPHERIALARKIDQSRPVKYTVIDALNELVIKGLFYIVY